MEITWDETKRRANLAKHDLDFADFANGFDFDRFVALDARRSRAGRLRYVLIGRWFGGRVVAAIVSPLGSEATALVSLRAASARERRAYEEV